MAGAETKNFGYDVTDTTFAMWTHVFSSELYRKYPREIRRNSPVRCTNKRTEYRLRRRIVNILWWHQNCLSIMYRADSQLLLTRSLDFKYFKTILKHSLAYVKCFESDSSCYQLCVQHTGCRISVPCANPLRTRLPVLYKDLVRTAQ